MLTLVQKLTSKYNGANSCETEPYVSLAELLPRAATRWACRIALAQS